MGRVLPRVPMAFSGLATGRSRPVGFCVSSVAALPTDPIGTHTLTLTNVVIGSRIAIRDQANTTTLYDQVAGTSTVAISLSAYAPGSQLNDLSIRVRKASTGTTYIPYETLTSIGVGASSIYVSQIPDE